MINPISRLPQEQFINFVFLMYGHTLFSCILYSFLLKSGYFEYLCDHAHLLSLVWRLAALWLPAHQALLSMGVFRRETGSRLLFLLQEFFPLRNQTPVSCIAGCFFTAEPSGNVTDGNSGTQSPPTAALLFVVAATVIAFVCLVTSLEISRFRCFFLD